MNIYCTDCQEHYTLGHWYAVNAAGQRSLNYRTHQDLIDALRMGMAFVEAS